MLEAVVSTVTSLLYLYLGAFLCSASLEGTDAVEASWKETTGQTRPNFWWTIVVCAVLCFISAVAYAYLTYIYCKLYTKKDEIHAFKLQREQAGTYGPIRHWRIGKGWVAGSAPTGATSQHVALGVDVAMGILIDSAPGPTILGREPGGAPAGAALETGVPGGHLTWDCPVCGLVERFDIEPFPDFSAK